MTTVGRQLARDDRFETVGSSLGCMLMTATLIDSWVHDYGPAIFSGAMMFTAMWVRYCYGSKIASRPKREAAEIARLKEELATY